MNDTTSAAESLALLASRCAAVPATLATVLADDANDEALAAAAALQPPFWVTGIGVAEGPARLFLALCQSRGVRAAFLPLSCFAGGPPPCDPPGTLVVFSQGLSPNARLALRAPHPRRVLVTAASGALTTDLKRQGALLLRHPPADEDRLLLRVQGPAAAALLALRLAAALPGDRPLRATDGTPLNDLAPLVALPAAVAAALGRAQALALPDLFAPLAFVGSGGYGDLCHGLRWKLLEGLWRDDPPAWDVLQVAHGPLQSFYDKPMTLLLLRRPEETLAERDLFRRLTDTLVPPRHQALSLTATLPAPLSFFEHDALCNGLLLRALYAAPRDLTRWPAQGRDGALYELGR